MKTTTRTSREVTLQATGTPRARPAALVNATRGLVEQLEIRAYFAGQITEVLPGVPFSTTELNKLGVETVNWNSKTRYAYDGQFIAKFEGISGQSTKQVRYARDLADAASTVTSLESQFGGQVEISQWLGSDGLVLVRAPKNASATQVANAMKRLPGFRYLEPNSLVWALDRIPNDPNFGSLYGMSKIEAPKAWDITTGGLSGDLVVGIVDTGIDYTHPDLAANMWTNPGETPGDNIDNDNNGYTDDYFGYNFAGVRNSNPYDDNRHGTHVAGTIAAAGNNSRGVTGVNWNAKLMAIKFLNSGGSGSLADAAAAINYQASMLERGVKVLISNNSWGGGGYEQSVKDAIDRYGNAGGLFVAAAGNDGSSGGSYPAFYNSPHILSVAASDENDNRASFSNYGSSWVDMAAPGNNILSTVPGNGYTTLSGTSMATPHVVGAAALLWDIAGTSTPRATIQNALLQGVDMLPQWNGLVNTSGRLNVFKSLNLLDLSWQVTGVTPDGSSTITEPLTAFTVTFSADYKPSSVSAGDLTVNSLPANSFELTGPRTLTFFFDETPLSYSGQQTIDIAPGAITRLIDNRGVDEFTRTFNYDAVELAVTASTPADGSTVPAPLTSIELEFSEGVDPASIDASDLTLSAGTVTGFEVLDYNRVRFDLAGLDDESVGSVVATLLSNEVTDDFGFGNSVWVGSFLLDNGTTGLNDAVSVGPESNLARALPATAGLINPAGEADEFTIEVDAGQQLTVIVDQVSTLHPAIEVLDAAGNVLSYTAPDDIGQDAVLQSQLIQATGVYTVRVFGEQSTVGSYRVQALLNSAVEEELHDLPANGSRSSAQSLDPAMMSLGIGGKRAVVRGTAEVGGGSGTSQYFREDFETTLDASWSTYSSLAQGRVRVGNSLGGYVSPSALLMDRNSSGPFNYNEAVWTVNLTGLQNPVLKFAHADLGDEEHALPASYSGRANGDGVSVSADGVHWHRVWQPGNLQPGSWQQTTVDLSAAAQAAGIPLGADFKIRFQQYDNLALPADGRGYDAVSITADASASDWYKFTGIGGKNATIALNTSASSTGVVELYNAAGSLLTSGVASGDDARQHIENFTLPANGIYYVRVSGVTGAAEDYSLLVAESVNLDVEPNDTNANAQDIGVGGNALGWASSEQGPDIYRFNVRSGDQLMLRTTTPGDDTGLIVNTLDPRLELYGPDGLLITGSPNGAADGRNVVLAHTAVAAGVFTVKLLPQSGAGNYVLSVQGNTGGAVPFGVTGVSPASNSIPIEPVSQITIDFTHTLLLSSLQAADLTVNGQTAASVEAIDKNTARFTLASPLSTGNYNVAIAAGAIQNLQGQPVQAFASSFRIDVTPPKLISSSVQQDDFKAVGSLSITLQFSEALVAANLDVTDFPLVATNAGITFNPSSFTYNPQNQTLTLNFASLAEDRYTLTIKSGDGAVEDIAGLDLDGEVAAWPLGAGGSGDGTAGGDFVVAFDLETATETLPPLARRSPLGGLIFASQKSSKIDFAADTDTFTVSLDAGQNVSLIVVPTGSLASIVELVDPSNNVIASNTAAPGARALVEAAAVAATGSYKIIVRSADGSTGGYTLQTTLNAIEEVESQNGTSNDSLATAESLDASAFVVSGSVSRLGVQGIAGAGTDDFYRFTMPAAGVATMVLSGVNASQLVLEIYDAGGTLVTTGNPFAGEIGRAVQNLSVTTPGEYFVRVSADSISTDLEYALVVSRNANINIEPNQNLATAQDLGQRGSVLGYQDALEGDDFYKLSVNAGDQLQITTSTPLDGAFLPGNNLDVAVELYNANGSLVASATGGATDGRNVQLSHTAVTGGVYVVRVIHQAGGGEYLLNVAGQAGGFLPLTVTEVTPSDNAIERSVPGTITVKFSHALVASSVQSSDLLIDGVAAAAEVQFIEADTLQFIVPGLTEGTHALSLPGGVVSNLDATPSNAFNSSFRIDLTPPIVAASSVAEGQFLGIGDLSMTIQFSESIRADLLSADDFGLRGNGLGVDYAPGTFSYDEATKTVTLNFQALPEDSYSLTVKSGDAGVEDLAGIDLDGDGDTLEGGDYRLNFALETISAAYPTPLTPVAPVAAGVSTGALNGKIDFAGDTDEYTLNVAAGSILSVVAAGSSGLRPTIQILDSNGATIGSASATAANGKALAQPARVVVGGTIKIIVGGVAGTTGQFQTQLTLGGTVEAEDNGGTANDTPATGQSIETGFIAAGGTVLRASVIGTLGTSSSERFAVYSDSFETPTFSPLWSFYKSNPIGRTARNTLYKTDGAASMAMDVSPANGQFALNEAVWTVNLTGLNSPNLKFSHADLGDEEHPMPATFSGHFNGDGVAVSPNGVNWFTVFSPGNLAAGQWQNYDINLQQLAQQNGFQLGSNFMVKFQQYDNLALPSDGRGWDNVQITAAGTSDHYRVTATAGQRLSVGVSGWGNGLIDLKIFSTAGNLLASGVAGAGSLDTVIDDFTASTAGDYIIRVAASLSSSEKYTLVVQKNGKLSDAGIA